MKKLFFIALVLFTNNLFSQTINDKPISEIDVEYIQIVGNSRFMSDKVTIEIDFGQNTTYFSTTRKETIIKDASGNNIKFNSMIDAINFMSNQGYDFTQSYAVTVSNQVTFYAIMRKG